MATGDDISKKMEELVNNLKLYSEKISIGELEYEKEKIKEYEKQIKALERKRDVAIESNDISDEEVEKTKKFQGLLKDSLKTLKAMGTATGQIYHNIAAAGNDFRSFLIDSTKQLKLAEDMARSYKKIGVEIGMTGKNAKFMEQSFKGALPAMLEMGLSADDLSSIYTDISNATGRVSTLTKEDAIRIGAVAESMDMSASESASMAESFMLMGVSTEKMEDHILETYKSSQSMGLNATKVIKTLQSNMGSLQSYSFAGGVKGMTEMAKQAVKMRLDVSDVLTMADKFYQPEAAIEAAANLQMLGGDIAKAFGDPFETMYMARNKPEELAKKVGEMTENMMQFNEETGEYEFPAEVRMQLKSAGEQLGINTDKMIEMARQTSKIKDIKMKFTSVGDDEMKESLASMAKFKDGKFVIETEKFGDLGLDQVTDDMAKTIMEENQTSEESLRDIATNTKVMSDQITNMQAGGQAKVAGLTNIYELTADEVAPMMQSMKDGIDTLATEYINKADVFIKDMFKNNEGDKSSIDTAMEEMQNLGTEIKDGTIKSFQELTKSSEKLSETLNANGDGGLGGGTDDLNDPGAGDFLMRSSGAMTKFSTEDDVVGAKKGGPIDRLFSNGLPSNGGPFNSSKVEFGSLNITGRIELVSPDGSTKNMDMASIKPMIEKTIISHLNGQFRNGGVASSKEATDYMAS
jgi:hypothetical protein